MKFAIFVALFLNKKELVLFGFEVLVSFKSHTLCGFLGLFHLPFGGIPLRAQCLNCLQPFNSSLSLYELGKKSIFPPQPLPEEQPCPAHFRQGFRRMLLPSVQDFRPSPFSCLLEPPKYTCQTHIDGQRLYAPLDCLAMPATRQATSFFSSCQPLMITTCNPSRGSIYPTATACCGQRPGPYASCFRCACSRWSRYDLVSLSEFSGPSFLVAVWTGQCQVFVGVGPTSRPGFDVVNFKDTVVEIVIGPATLG